PFSKHLHVVFRASGSYGNRNRIAVETRGGVDGEKKLVLGSLLRGLVEGRWGAGGYRYGDGEFRLLSRPRLGAAQYTTAPIASLVRAHLEAHPSRNVAPEDAERLEKLVASATFYEGDPPPARLRTFDQRVASPLLNYEALPFLTSDDRQRVI